MYSLARRLYSKTNLDSSIIFSILTRIIQSLGTVLSLLLITSLLTQNEQGYYYTFTSLIALQIFLEFGLNSIIIQYIAHEVAHLSWHQMELVGDDYHKSRLASIVKLSIKWFLFLSVILFGFLFVVGQQFFSHYNAELSIAWQLPWIVLTLATSLQLVTNLVITILEGLGQVKQMARIRLIQQLITTALLAGFLLAGFKLLAAGAASLIASAVILTLLMVTKPLKMLRHIWKIPITHTISYRNEVFAFHYKMGLGNISSYLIYQIFSPILFATQGAIVAGQMGATQTFLTGILGISLTWFSTKTFLFSNLVATKSYNELNTYYRNTLAIAIMVCLSGVVVFILMVALLKTYYPVLGNRFLPIVPIVLFGVTQISSVIGNAQAYYLRSFKIEPFFIPSLLTGLLSGAATVIISKFYSITEMSIAYFLINAVLGFLWGCMIFRTKSYTWTKYRHVF